MISTNDIKILYTAEEINYRVQTLANEIMNNYSENEEIIMICLLKGGFIFTADLIRELSRKIKIEFMSVSSYGDKLESSGIINIKQDVSCDINNKNIIIIDDIIDTGNTLFNIKQHLINKKPNKIETCCLLDKSEGRLQNITADYIGFKCPNKYVIGYGMDAASNYRNLPYIGYIE
jgi:hypoxanthine phosphoribosyltransferase